MRIGTLSDLHLDFNTYMLAHGIEVIHKLAEENNLDVLLLVGDTSNSFTLTNDIALELTSRGIDTYFIMGNHEHWSITYEAAQTFDTNRYINNQIKAFGDKKVIAIDGTFDYSYVDVDEYVLNKHGRKFFDLARIKTKDFNKLSEIHKNNLRNLIKQADKNTIVITHYLPSVEFTEKRDYVWNMNNAFMGSDYVEIIRDKVDKVIFGHTHTAHNKVINDVEYVCSPIGYRDYEFNEPIESRIDSALVIL